VNVFDVELEWDDDDPEGYHPGYKRLGPDLGAEQLGMSVYEIPPGNSVCPYHYEIGAEEWLFVLVGRPTLRTPEGEQELRPWDCAFFPDGEAGAHKVTNRTDETVRIAILSNKDSPGGAVYPDSNKVGMWPPGKLFRLGDDVSYWDGEAENGPDTRTSEPSA
jgi:uncharacterized cupin superfamily protein